MPELRRTRATLRRAEFGFLGVVVYTRVHTPRRCGAPLRAGVLVLSALVSRPLRTSCAMVGNALAFRSSAICDLRSRKWCSGAATERRHGQRDILRPTADVHKQPAEVPV